MPVARSLSIDPHKIQIIHAWSRVVRRSFLCGYDTLLDRDYDYRRQWFRDRIQFLAQIYAVDVITYSVMHNHTHQLLRSRPDVVESLKDEEVARRIMKLDGPKWFRPDGSDRKSTLAEVERLCQDPERILVLRERLSNVSKWMQSLNQHIAKKANAEDECTGAFFEGRFGSEVLEETPAVLACSIYIDLNPNRARIANTPEESDYTGAFERIHDLRMYLAEEDGGTKIEFSHSGVETHDWERLEADQSGWLSPIEIDEQCDPIGADRDPSGRRASRKGVFCFSLSRYLELLEWSGRAIRKDKRGAIPVGLNPILERLGLTAKQMLQSITTTGMEKDNYFQSTERKGRPDLTAVPLL